MRQRLLRHPERRIDIRLHRGIERFRGDVGDGILRLLAAGVQHQHLKPAQLVQRIVHHLAGGLFIADVCGQGDGGAALGLDQGNHAVGVGLLVGVIADRDIGAFAGKGDGSGAADAAVAAGDQRALAGQPVAALIALLAVVGDGLHLFHQPGPGLLIVGIRVQRQARILDRARAVRGDDGVGLILAGHGAGLSQTERVSAKNAEPGRDVPAKPRQAGQPPSRARP